MSEHASEVSVVVLTSICDIGIMPIIEDLPFLGGVSIDVLKEKELPKAESTPQFHLH
jgi:hypothetical protein